TTSASTPFVTPLAIDHCASELWVYCPVVDAMNLIKANQTVIVPPNTPLGPLDNFNSVDGLMPLPTTAIALIFMALPCRLGCFLRVVLLSLDMRPTVSRCDAGRDCQTGEVQDAQNTG